MKKKYLILVLIIICVVLSIANQLQNYNCEPFAKVPKPPVIKLPVKNLPLIQIPVIKPPVIKPSVKTTTTAVKTSSSSKPNVSSSSKPNVSSSSSIIKYPIVHLSASKTGIIYKMDNSSSTTPIKSTDISFTKFSTKYVMQFSSTGRGQIIIDRSSWSVTKNFNNGMTIFAVVQPTQNANPNTGLINITKQNTDKNYYPTPLLLYNSNYFFGDGTDEYDVYTNSGAKNFWSGNNNTPNQLLQLYTLVINKSPSDGKIYVTEYINRKSVYTGTFSKYLDSSPYAPIYIGNCIIGTNSHNVFIGTLAELAIYNIGLSDDELITNWDILSKTWNI